MNIRDELFHHIFPSVSGAGLMLTLGEQFLYSIGVGVCVYCVTHIISFIARSIFSKIKCK